MIRQEDMAGYISFLENIYGKNMKIKIDNIELENPKIEIDNVNDNFKNEVSVNVKITGDGYSLGRNIGSFSYKETWENKDVLNYIEEWKNQVTMS